MPGVAIPIFVIMSGWPESGKSTIAKALEADRNFGRLSYGAPVKHYVNETDPHVQTMIKAFGEEAAKQHPGVRNAYQEEGERIARIFGEATLANALQRKAEPLLREGISIVSDDARRPPELNLGSAMTLAGTLLGRGPRVAPLTIRVARYKKDGTPHLVPDHPLEHLLDDVKHDACVINTEDNPEGAINAVKYLVDKKRQQLKRIQSRCTCPDCNPRRSASPPLPGAPDPSALGLGLLLALLGSK